MSELKEHFFCYIDEVFPRGYLGPLPSKEMRPYYLKSEADKVIAELKSERDGAMGLNLIGMTLEDYQAAADKVLNFQKRLRCEALIKVCLAKSQTWACRYYYAETDARHKICFDFMIHYNKRAEVLRKLAEKIKETQ